MSHAQSADQFWTLIIVTPVQSKWRSIYIASRASYLMHAAHNNNSTSIKMDSAGKPSRSINIGMITETDCSQVDDEKKPLLSDSTTDKPSVTSASQLSPQWSLKSMLKRGRAYKIRTFSSRGACLVLVLNFLVSAGYGVPAGNGNSYHFYEDPHQHHKKDGYPDEPTEWTIRDIIPILVWFPSIVILGLLADVQYGRKRVVWCGILLLWVVTIVDCVRAAIYYYLKVPHDQFEIELFSHIVFTIDAVLCYVATGAFLVNSVQMAVDQLADASAEQVSSFIQWYFFTYFLGAWVFNQATSPQGPLFYCFHITSRGNFKILSSFVQVVFVSLALCLVTICGHWIEVTTIRNNPLKLIWRVLRFAAKHKYPLYRSALTYWEDEIPSRINLGKDKYGGPFTNEQVEDVKTFLRMISLALPCVAPAIACFLTSNVFVFSVSQNWNSSVMDFGYTFMADHAKCAQSLYAAFLSNVHIWLCIFVLCSELIVYPLANRYFPRMLNRIGWTFFLIIPESLALLSLNIVALAADQTHPLTINRLAICSVVTAISALGFYLIVSTFLEFICAQSPQSMKGFLIGFMWLITVLLVVIAYFIYYVFSLKCSARGCGTAYFSLVMFLGVVGFIVYCMVARWYKHRERDDCPNDQAIVEEVFARRLANRGKDMTSSIT